VVRILRALRTGLVGVVAAAGLVVAGTLTGTLQASDDWDWGAVEAMDDAPVTRPAAPTPPTPPSAASTDANYAQQRRDAARAAPDFERETVAAVEIFPGAGDFSVVPARQDRDMHPCANCHQWVLSNPEPRKLAAPHDNFELQHGMHGKGGFWCLTCHDEKDNMTLKTFEGEPVAYEHAYVICTQCHVQQGRDWARGAHGKRIGNWTGERQVYNCTACHYQHRPAIKPREALPGPAMRVGLPRPEHWVAADERPGNDDHHSPDWQRDIDRRREAREPDSSADTAASEPSEVSDAES
jgi:hypothetical protein